jgi:hypothetical protein
MDYQKNKEFEDLNKTLLIALHENDVSVIDKIMTYDKYPALSKDEREKAIFDYLSLHVDTYNEGHDILRYLIIDYKIHPKNSINRCGGKISKTVNSIFRARKFNSVLQQELDSAPKAETKRKINKI